MTLTKNSFNLVLGIGVRLQCTEEGLGIEEWKRLNTDYSSKSLTVKKKKSFSECGVLSLELHTTIVFLCYVAMNLFRCLSFKL